MPLLTSTLIVPSLQISQKVLHIPTKHISHDNFTILNEDLNYSDSQLLANNLKISWWKVLYKKLYPYVVKLAAVFLYDCYTRSKRLNK